MKQKYQRRTTICTSRCAGHNFTRATCTLAIVQLLNFAHSGCGQLHRALPEIEQFFRSSSLFFHSPSSPVLFWVEVFLKRKVLVKASNWSLLLRAGGLKEKGERGVWSNCGFSTGLSFNLLMLAWRRTTQQIEISLSRGYVLTYSLTLCMVALHARCTAY